MANPTLLDMPIARDGNKNTIPTTDNGTTGLLSQQYGWQLINAIPPQQGGKAVKREDFNGALYLLSNLLFYLQKGWQFEWDSNQDYYAGCVTKDPTDGKMYRAKNDVTANNTEPHSDTTNWEIWDLSSYLPLSGGTMTGTRIFRSREYPYYLALFGGPAGERCGDIQLMGSGFDDTDKNSGRVVLEALSDIDSDITQLFIKRDGRITAKIPAYNSQIDIAGSAIVAKSSLGTNGYIKLASGEIRQWGYVASGTDDTITFPIAFTGNFSFCAIAESVNTYVSESNISKTSVRVLSPVACAKRWLAFGY